MANVQIVLLEHVDNLGRLGDVVNVKAGYARNYLLPQKKALRATSDNLAYFEQEKAKLEAANEKKVKDAQTEGKKIDGLKVVLIRQAAEDGRLYGSVASRDIAEAVKEVAGISVKRNQVVLNQPIKTIGLFDVTIALYGDIKYDVSINVARTSDEAEIQEKTGTALIAADDIVAQEVIEEQQETAEAANDDQVAEEETKEEA